MKLIKYKRVPLIREKGRAPVRRTLKLADDADCKILLVCVNLTIDEIERINTGRIKVIEDYSWTRQEMMDKIAEGYDPEIYFTINSV